MNTQQLSPNDSSLQQTARRNWMWLGLGLAVTALAIYQVGTAMIGNNAPAGQRGGAAEGGLAPVARLDPAAQSVADYLRVHSNDMAILPPVAVMEPSAQSVADYLRVHQNDLSIQPPAAPIDPATQSVLDYIKAHGG